jgi:hypothetical protein
MNGQSTAARNMMPLHSSMPGRIFFSSAGRFNVNEQRRSSHPRQPCPNPAACCSSPQALLVPSSNAGGRAHSCRRNRQS